MLVAFILGYVIAGVALCLLIAYDMAEWPFNDHYEVVQCGEEGNEIVRGRSGREGVQGGVRGAGCINVESSRVDNSSCGDQHEHGQSEVSRSSFERFRQEQQEKRRAESGPRDFREIKANRDRIARESAARRSESRSRIRAQAIKCGFLGHGVGGDNDGISN